MATIAPEEQLIAVAPQDEHLSLNPEFSFFNNDIIKHTPFVFNETVTSMFDIVPGGKQQTPQPGTKLSLKVEPNGDVVADMSLMIIGIPGENLASSPVDGRCFPSPFDRLMVQIDGNLVHDVDDAAYSLMNSVFDSPEQHSKRLKLVKRYLDGTFEMYLPIRWRLMYPIIAASASVMSVTVHLSKQWTSFQHVNLLCTYVYVGAPERTRFQNTSMKILYNQYESLQGTNSVVDSDNEVHFKPSITIDLSSLQNATKFLTFAVEEQDVSGWVDVVKDVQLTIGGVTVLSEPFPAEYFNMLNVYKYCNGYLSSQYNPGYSPVYCYSFALNPISPSPSGAFDMSQQIKKYLSVSFSRLGNFTVRVCVLSWNALAVQNRQATVMYA